MFKKQIYVEKNNIKIIEKIFIINSNKSLINSKKGMSAQNAGRHRWEHDRTFKNIQLKPNGDIFIPGFEDKWESQAELKRQELSGVTRGLIRSLCILVDLSKSGLQPNDFSAISRLRLIEQSLEKFVIDYFDQNPLSQLSIVVTYNSKGWKYSDLSGNVDIQLKAIQRLGKDESGGNASLSNGLLTCSSILSCAASYSTREVLIIYGSLNTTDSSNILDRIKELKDNKICVSAIGLASKIFILEKITSETNGTYFVPKNAEHFQDLLQEKVLPPEWIKSKQFPTLIRFGFAKNANDHPAFNSNDLMSNPKAVPIYGGFDCPICSTRVFDLPCYCPICGIFLISPAHLTRSMHYLNPIPNFESIKVDHPEVCEGCNVAIPLNEEGCFCPNCHKIFCNECNKFIHTCLQNCPGCLSNK